MLSTTNGGETNRENLREDSQWIVAQWPLSTLTKPGCY